MHPQNSGDVEIQNPTKKAPPISHRNPPSPPSFREQIWKVPPPSLNSKAGGHGGPLGAFSSTQHSKGSHVAVDKGGTTFYEERTSQCTSKHDQWSPKNLCHPKSTSPPKEQNVQPHALKSVQEEHSGKRFEEWPSKDFERRFSSKDADLGSEKAFVSQSKVIATFQNEAFNTFVAEFDISKLDSRFNSKESGTEAVIEDEVDMLKEQLKQANKEKDEITSKYEKLSAICSSQWQEIQELKQALAAPKNQISSGSWQSASPLQREKIEGTVWELQQGMFANSSPMPDSKSSQAFPEEPKAQPLLKNYSVKSVWTTNRLLP